MSTCLNYLKNKNYQVYILVIQKQNYQVYMIMKKYYQVY